jgi:hypothetical protein
MGLQLDANYLASKNDCTRGRATTAPLVPLEIAMR